MGQCSHKAGLASPFRLLHQQGYVWTVMMCRKLVTPHTCLSARKVDTDVEEAFLPFMQANAWAVYSHATRVRESTDGAT